MEEAPFAVPCSANNCWDLVPHVAVILYFLTYCLLLDLVHLPFVSPEIFRLRVFLLASSNRGTQSLKDVFKMPEESSQMSAADNDIYLSVVTNRLLYIAQCFRP